MNSALRRIRIAINAFLNDTMEKIGRRQDLGLALDGFSQAAMEAGGELEGRGGA